MRWRTRLAERRWKLSVAALLTRAATPEAPLTIEFAATAPLSAREPRDGQAVAGLTPLVQGPLTVAGALAVTVSHRLDESHVFCWKLHRSFLPCPMCHASFGLAEEKCPCSIWACLGLTCHLVCPSTGWGSRVELRRALKKIAQPATSLEFCVDYLTRSVVNGRPRRLLASP